MGWTGLQCCAPVGEPRGGLPTSEGERRLLQSEVVMVPLQAILYLQPMAENGPGDQPKPRGLAVPFGHVRYRQ